MTSLTPLNSGSVYRFTKAFTFNQEPLGTQMAHRLAGELGKKNIESDVFEVSGGAPGFTEAKNGTFVVTGQLASEYKALKATLSLFTDDPNIRRERLYSLNQTLADRALDIEV